MAEINTLEGITRIRNSIFWIFATIFVAAIIFAVYSGDKTQILFGLMVILVMHTEVRYWDTKYALIKFTQKK
jgi:hypothetical protein